MKFKLFKKNWLMSLGLFFLTLGLLALYLSQSLPISSSIQPNSSFFSIPYNFLIIAALIIAPILEEITFRGVFTKNKILKWFSLIAIILLVVFSNTIALKIVFVPYILSLFYYNSKKNNVSLNILILLNALLFSFAHLNNDYINNIEYIFAPLFIRFAMGLFLVWICINFSIIKSMIFHAIWNLCPVVFMSYILFFPNTEINHFENNELKVTWNRVSKSTSKVNIFPKTNKNSILSESSEVLFLLKSLEWSKNKSDGNYKFNPIEPYMNYKFDIELKDTIHKYEDLYNKIETFLIASKLVERIKLNTSSDNKNE